MLNILDEKMYAEGIIANGFQSKKWGLELFILAKYNRFLKNMSKKDCKDDLTEICNKNIRDYNLTDYYLTLKKAIDNAYKKDAKLFEIKSIEFSSGELDFIKNLAIAPKSKRLLFCLLCCSKINELSHQSKFWINIAINRLKKMNNCASNSYTVNILNELISNELIFINDKGSIYLSFLNNNFTGLIRKFDFKNIEEFNTCGLWWEKYVCNDKRVIKCNACNMLVWKSSNRQIYCNDCSKGKVREKYIKYNKKREQVK